MTNIDVSKLTGTQIAELEAALKAHRDAAPERASQAIATLIDSLGIKGIIGGALDMDTGTLRLDVKVPKNALKPLAGDVKGNVKFTNESGKPVVTRKANGSGNGGSSVRGERAMSSAPSDNLDGKLGGKDLVWIFADMPTIGYTRAQLVFMAYAVSNNDPTLDGFDKWHREHVDRDGQTNSQFYNRQYTVAKAVFGDNTPKGYHQNTDDAKAAKLVSKADLVNAANSLSTRLSS